MELSENKPETENKPEKGAGVAAVFKEFKLKFKEPGAAIFTNNMLVQRDDTVAYVSFYQTIPPLMIGDEQEQKAAIEALDSIEAIPVVRVAIPLGKLEALIGALKTIHDTLGGK